MSGRHFDIVASASHLSDRVQVYREQARAFFHAVMLLGHRCPDCEGPLAAIRDGWCRCMVCGRELDPTLAFQQCDHCGGAPRIRIRRYECSACSAEIISGFFFDGLVFDVEYFRQKMAEHREREAERRERVRQLLAGTRSPALEDLEINGSDASDLFMMLDAMVAPGIVIPASTPREQFNLQRYETHIQACLGTIEVPFDRIPPLSGNAFLDRVWRFIAIVFLAHAGAVRLRQAGTTIWVIPHEADGERQAVPGDLENADGIEGLAG